MNIWSVDSWLPTTNGQFKLWSNKMLISVYPLRSVDVCSWSDGKMRPGSPLGNGWMAVADAAALVGTCCAVVVT